MLQRLARLCIIALALSAAATLSACGDDAEVPRTAVATVDGKPISNSDFKHWVGVVSASQQGASGKRRPKPPKPGTPQYEQLTNQVMLFLVTAQWIAGEAADRGLSASDQEIKQSFERTKKQSFPTDKAYKRFLRSSGQTQEDIDFRVRSDVLATKVREDATKKAADVSDDDVKNYYEQNEAQFSQPERRDLQVVVNKDEQKAREALQRLQDGESFKKVVKDLSTDPATKQQDGKLLGVAKGQQEKALDAAVFGTVKDKLTGPVKTQQGFYVFKVTKITPATKQTLEQSKEGIRQLLLSQKQQQALDAFTKDFREKWREKTDCRKTYVIPDCSNGEQPPLGVGSSGPPAKSGIGTPPALTPAQPTAPQPTIPGAPPTNAPGAVGGTPAVAPPATSGAGLPPALGGAPAVPTGPPQGEPGQATPPQGAPPPQQAQPPGG